MYALGLMEEVAIAGVAGEQGLLIGEADDAAADGAAALGRRRVEVAVHEARARHAVRVDEQQPVAACARAAPEFRAW